MVQAGLELTTFWSRERATMTGPTVIINQNQTRHFSPIIFIEQHFKNRYNNVTALT
jgi:hypothetical protein